jgi:hypothetical protein
MYCFIHYVSFVISGCCGLDMPLFDNLQELQVQGFEQIELKPM